MIRFDGRVFDSPDVLYLAGFRAGRESVKRVYAIVSIDLLTEDACMNIERIYFDLESAQANIPKDDDYCMYRIEEYEVVE